MASLLREKDVVVKVVVVFDGVCDVVFLSSPFLLLPKKTMCVCVLTTMMMMGGLL